MLPLPPPALADGYSVAEAADICLLLHVKALGVVPPFASVAAAVSADY